MDRRLRPFLNLLLGGGIVALPLTGLLGAPDATPTASPAATATATAAPAVSATPWVQASPPPGTPAPAPHSVMPTATPTPKHPDKAIKPPKPPHALSSDDLTHEMMQRREAEERDAAKANAAHTDLAAKPAAPPKADKPDPKPPVRLDQIPPDERAAYERNLPLWRQLPEEERDALRRRADERAKQEMEKAYQESGLNLDHDQREVFDLRYRQERRKVERELQEKANAERARRLAEVSDRLKHEFAGRPVPASAPSAPDAPVPAPKRVTPKPAPTAATPDATPLPGFMR